MSEVRWLPIIFAFLLVVYLRRDEIRRALRKKTRARSVAFRKETP